LNEEIKISKKNYQDQSELLIKVRDNLRKEEEKSKKLQKESAEEKSELLELLEKTRKKLKEQEKQNQKLQQQLDLTTNKSASGKLESFKSFKKRTMTRFQQLKKKVKSQGRELIAKIEVKAK